jgi:hypothetical protein
MAADTIAANTIAANTITERPIYIAKRLADAKRLEEVLTAADVEYEVEPDTYQGGIVFRSARVGAFFYVEAEQRERATAVMRENGFTPLSSEATT